ncbi:hypothetical protein AK88_01091 [Plasmodium fragile]|uniref:StAR-related lipid transfer protein n=1 Tax=Plasmodium fragile TaxID=5857 RepID=A0A0D9QQL7_PLAFR|nr:uncharacterized protein AK88_01091 [Plasmodium fragile]KJP89213.1 hypothetical protein AK88_01091 [Plasmodium fragile]
MILKKSKLLALSLLLALVQYLYGDGRLKWMNLFSRWESSSYEGSDLILSKGRGGKDVYAFSRKSAFPFSKSYEQVRQKERSKSSNLVCIVPSDMPHFRMLHELEQAANEPLLIEQTEGDVNVIGNADHATAMEELPPQSVATKDSPLMEKNMVNHYLDVCKKIRNNQFSFNNCEPFHKSQEVTLYKNILQDKSKTRYDLIGYGTLDDVSLYGASQALNDIDIIKKWNKNIYKINYLKLTKEAILDKFKNGEKIDASKYILQNEHVKANRRYIYLINGLPWPFRSHDTVYEFYQKYIPEENMLLVANKSVNNVFSDSSYYTRIRDYENFFCLYPKNKNSYEKGLEYVISVYYDVNIPVFIRNNILSQIFPALIWDLHKSSKQLTDEGLSFSVEQIQMNQLPFLINDSAAPEEVLPGPEGKDAQESTSPFYGASVLRVIFVDPFHFIWTTNVNLFKKIYVIVTSIF